MNIPAKLEQILSAITGNSDGFALLSAELDKARASIVLLESKITEAEAASSGVVAQSAALATENASLIAERDKIKADFEAFKASPSLQGAQMLASAGVPLAQAPKASVTENKQVVSMEEFNALKPAARLKFVKSGGKIS